MRVAVGSRHDPLGIGPGADTPMTASDPSWEYRVEVLRLTGKDDSEAARADAVANLDRLGQAGWEAVGFSPAQASSHGLRVETTQFVVLLKRHSEKRR
jgi:hypothetical protein